MATPTDSTAAHGVTRGKLILIGVLGAVFVFVVYWNYFRDGSTTSASAPLADAPLQQSVASASAAGGPGPAAGRSVASAQTTAQIVPVRVEEKAARRRPWPEFELAAVLAYDPFARPSQFPQPPPSLPASAAIDDQELKAAKERAAAQERAATLKTIKQKGVELIFSQNGQEYVAKIGEMQVRVGDEIGGFRVVKIDLHGVTLEGVSTP